MSQNRLSHQIVFQVKVVVSGKNIYNTVVEKGASTCIMYISCWKALGSPWLAQSGTTLKAFDSHTFQP